MNQVKLPKQSIMYRALVEKDSSYEGIFFAAIKTTGIFCRPTCTARKPKEQNVEYFTDTKSALSSGYRPCKVCFPMQPSGEKPEWLSDLLKDISANPEIKIKDDELKKRGVDPARVRRWFNKNHGITFQAYTRALRINRAFSIIKKDKTKQIQQDTPNSLIDTAFDSGYESLSGFNEAFKKFTGTSPTLTKNTHITAVTRLLTPLGPMMAGATDKGICLLEFIDRIRLEKQLIKLSKQLETQFIPGQHPLFDLLEQQLIDYFDSKLSEFTIPLDISGTEFQRQVWQQLLKIPYGETWSYQQQAEAINNPKAVRAVAKTNGENRIAIIVPCHRVIGKNGKLTGYAGGLWRKQRLLELETGVFALKKGYQDD
ncbi:MAG: AraC family transcriptional regulator of adaptative response [Enterobacterales bacterium]|jgi:AraC family transcriptional regulator of adaptative response/methylated-DNA-[protein]-cysteine methyltransferase